MFNHIVSHPTEVVDMTIRELADSLHVSMTLARAAFPTWETASCW